MSEGGERLAHILHAVVVLVRLLTMRLREDGALFSSERFPTANKRPYD